MAFPKKKAIRAPIGFEANQRAKDLAVFNGTLLLVNCAFWFVNSRATDGAWKELGLC